MKKKISNGLYYDMVEQNAEKQFVIVITEYIDDHQCNVDDSYSIVFVCPTPK